MKARFSVAADAQEQNIACDHAECTRIQVSNGRKQLVERSQWSLFAKGK